MRILLLLILACVGAVFAAEKPLPNIVVIFADDLGYADIGSSGAKGYQTPHLDELARNGRRFTSFYAAQAVCSASRAALLTGCYPNRVGIHGALGPKATHGLNTTEVTLAELVKQRGYATAMFGKWHLSHHTKFLPTRHGFDEYYGIPYSNDMWPRHPEAPKGTYPDLPLIEGEKTVATNPDQTRFTTDFTTRAVRFIQRNKEKPFFLYLAHPMPHVPLFVSDKFDGKTERGLYGDVIAEIDWSVGEVVKALRENGLRENTLVIFTSDNGPWLSYGDHAGSAAPLREGKGTAWEGGVRVPCVMSWPGKIPANSASDAPAMTIDIVPTVAALIDAELPNHAVDGKNIWPLISGEPGAKNPHESYLFYFGNNELQALRSGKWKLVAPHRYRSLDGARGGTNGIPSKYKMLKADWALFDLEQDVSETRNLADAHPEVVERLQKLMDRAREDLGDALQGKPGANRREPGRI